MSSKPSKFPIAYIEIRVFSHATEDIEKVQTAVRNTLPESLSQDIIFSKSNLDGHHGNPIILVEAKLEDRKILLSALEKIGASLTSFDKEALNEELKIHIEKRSLFLRFDKQSSYLGQLKLSSIDPIHFKIHFKNRTPEEIEDICRKAGVLP